MANEFKVEIPIEQSGSNSGNSGGGKNLGFSKLAGAVAAGNLASMALSTIMEGLMKTLEPLINILKALFIVVFLPLMPLIVTLTEIIGELISAFMDGKDDREALRNAMTFGVLQVKEADGLFVRVLKNAGAFIVDTGILLGQMVTGALKLWSDLWVSIGEKFAPVVEMVWNFITGIFQSWSDLWVSIGSGIVDVIKTSLNFLSNLGTDIWNIIKSPFQWLADKISSFVSKLDIGGRVKRFFGGGKAVGGPVSSGGTYLVGERGPELFTPSGNGSITPNNKLGSGTININVTGNKFNSEQDMRKMVNMISNELQKKAGRSMSR